MEPVAPAELVRLRDAVARGLRDPMWGTELGRLFLEGKLTAEEYEAVKKHPHRGVQVLKSIHSLKPLVPIILHHHERYDGMGYPKGLKGEEIPIGARIIAVVDSFTAMISSRPYRETRKMAEAVEEIKRHSGTQFDPKVVESFLKVIQEKKIK